MKLIIGLGNPGRKYKKTRHNVGFRVLDEMIKDSSTSLRTSFKFDKKFNADVVKKGQIIFAKPQTFMNKSGEAVWAIQKYYKIKSDDIVVVHDELYLELGKVRESTGSRSAGHNGVQSIINLLDTKNFTRVRIGIGPCPKKIPAEKFVLQKFSRKEEKELEEIIKRVIEIIKNKAMVS
ncbi:MAG: aminoacyl-tRNA hydrolase [Patescibacteria group bacterium]|nr:aminoacyl-tRNA hydrolase [Patescibacteria group bacterium]